MKLKKVAASVLAGTVIAESMAPVHAQDYIKVAVEDEREDVVAVQASNPDIVIRPGEYDGKPGKRAYINPNAMNIPDDIPVKVDEHGYYIQEFDINLKLSKEIARKLREKGVNVEFQVANGKYQDLNAAGRRAKATGAKMYLSVHHNSYKEDSSGYFFMVNKNSPKEAEYARRLSNSINNGEIRQEGNRVQNGYIGEMNETDSMINILGEFGYFSNVNELQKIISNERVDYVSTQIANEIYEILMLN